MAQTFGRLALCDQVIHRRRAEIGQFLDVRLDHPRRSLHTFAQGRATAVEGDLQAEAPQAPQQFAQPFRLDLARQAAGDHRQLVLPGKPVEAFEQRRLGSLVGLRARPVEVADAPAALGQLDVAAGFARHPDERIGEATTLEHGGERRLVLFAEEAADRQPMAEVGKHPGDVQTLPAAWVSTASLRLTAPSSSWRRRTVRSSAGFR